MDKKTMIQKLKDYNKMQSELSIKKLELEKVKDELREIGSGYDENMANTYGLNSDIRPKNKVSDKISETIIKNENERKIKERLIKEIGLQIKQLKFELRGVKARLKILGDNERKLVVAYYINGKTAEQISRTTYFELFQRTTSEKTIWNIISKSIERMAEI